MLMQAQKSRGIGTTHSQPRR